MTSLPCGSVTSTFFRLCVRAPRTMSGPRAGCLASGILFQLADLTLRPCSGSSRAMSMTRSALREFQRDRKRKMVLPRFGYRKSGPVAQYRHDECHEKSCGSERAAKEMCERRETAQRLDFKAFATTLRSATSDS